MNLEDEMSDYYDLVGDDLFKRGDVVEVSEGFIKWAKLRLGIDLSGRYVVHHTVHNPCLVAIDGPLRSLFVHESALMLVERSTKGDSLIAG